MTKLIWVEDAGPSVGGDWVNGRPADWAWCAADGGYWRNHGFFDVHWEVHPDQGVEAIRLHVESPRYADDPELNDIKREMIHPLLASAIEQKVQGAGLGFAWGRQISDANIRRNKCTEVFRAILGGGERRIEGWGDLRLVHEVLGATVEQALTPLRSRIDARLPHGFTTAGR